MYKIYAPMSMKMFRSLSCIFIHNLRFLQRCSLDKQHFGVVEEKKKEKTTIGVK